MPPPVPPWAERLMKHTGDLDAAGHDAYAAGGGPIALDSLTDVDTTSSPPTFGMALVWNGSLWVPGSVAGGSGSLGPMGPRGLDGDDGEPGPIGPPGLQGSPGPAGSPGVDGAIGPMGYRGLDGADGDDAMWGPQGPQGPQGAQGATGSQGPAGTSGIVLMDTHDDGADALWGPQGVQGVQGATGPTGSQGPMGGFVLLNPAMPDEGDQYLNLGPPPHPAITNRFFLNAMMGFTDGTTLANIGASPDLTRVLTYADAATSGSFWTFMVPPDWATGLILAQPVWSPGATDGVAHTVRWSYTAKAIAAGSTVTAAGTTTAWTGASAARTVGVVVYDTATSTGITPAAPGDWFRLTVQRIGADAADTYVGVVNLLGLIVSYTANP